AVLGARYVRGGPAREPVKGLPGCGPQRDELGVLDPPPTRELLDDQLRVEEQVDLARAELTRELERADDTSVFGDVVGLDAEIVRDRRVRPRERITGIGPVGPEQCRAGRCGPGVPPGGA